MTRLAFSAEDQQALHKERFEHPHPRVQQRMEVLWLISQGLVYPEAARLAGVSEATVDRYEVGRPLLPRSLLTQEPLADDSALLVRSRYIGNVGRLGVKGLLSIFCVFRLTSPGRLRTLKTRFLICQR